jgi:excisionase family DNA binding protein
MEQFVFSLKEAATALSISKTALYGYMDAGLIPYHYNGNRRVITRQALDDFSDFCYENGSIGPMEVEHD